jgi:hypothetical protein
MTAGSLDRGLQIEASSVLVDGILQGSLVAPQPECPASPRRAMDLGPGVRAGAFLARLLCACPPYAFGRILAIAGMILQLRRQLGRISHTK